jgi:hypothetical protein
MPNGTMAEDVRFVREFPFHADSAADTLPGQVFRW